MTGIMSARLAALGFTGVPSILTFAEYAPWVQDIGSEYLLPRGIMWKKYSCCAWAHPAINALRTILEANPVQPEHVDRIILTVYREAARLGAALPTTTEEAQFNLAWPVAVFLAYGEVAPRHVLESQLSDPTVHALASKVEIEDSHEFTRLYDLADTEDPRGKEVADVRLELDDGRTLSSGVQPSLVYGDWPRDEIEAKFRWLARDLLGERATDELIGMTWRLDKLDDVRELTKVIGEATRARI